MRTMLEHKIAAAQLDMCLKLHKFIQQKHHSCLGYFGLVTVDSLIELGNQWAEEIEINRTYDKDEN